MDTAQLFFRTRDTKNAEEVLDKVQGYLAALLHNGQIVGDHMPMAKVSGGYLVTASLPETDALADRFADQWVRKRLRELAAVGVDRPKVTQLGTDPESRSPCKCRKRPFLILFTTFITASPPLRCGACFDPIALYRVPAANESGNHQDVQSQQLGAADPIVLWSFSGLFGTETDARLSQATDVRAALQSADQTREVLLHLLRVIREGRTRNAQ